MFLANNFPLSDAEDNTSGLLNRRVIADLPLLRTLLAICQKPREPSFWQVMHSFVSLLACLNFTLDSKDLLYWCKQKWFLWTVAAAEEVENLGDEWGLTWWLWWGIYTSIPAWVYSAAEAVSLKISFHGASLKWSQSLSQSTRG